MKQKQKSSREKRGGDASPRSSPAWRAPLLAAALALCAYRVIEYHNYWNSLSPVVEVKQGPLQGRAARTDAGTEYFAFQGIPYAAPPVGLRRYRDPQPPASWGPEVRDARADGPVCSQGPMVVPMELPSNVSVIDVVRFLGKIPTFVHRAVKLLRQSEDCLHLNVYTPKVPKVGAGVSLPVFVYIHGGAFVYGDNGVDMIGPQTIVERDVILVTINYRLGALGFLALGEAVDGRLTKAPEGVGNAGLKDIVAALRWVRDNIAQFGGDPGRVTVGGQSAGGVLASYLTVVPSAKGLFHQLAAMSGCLLHHWGFSTPEQALARTRTLVRNLLRPEVAGGPGAPAAPDVDDPQDVLRFLREVDVRLLLDKDNYADVEEESLWLLDEFPFQPTVDGVLVPGNPLDLIRAGRVHHVPTMAGVTAREGLFAIPSALAKRRPLENQAAVLEADFQFSLPDYLRDAFPPGSQELQQMEAAAREHFFSSGDISEVALIDFYGLTLFDFDMHRFLKEYAAVSTAPVFAYNFTYEGRNNLFRRTMLFHVPDHWGATHCDDLSYLFHVDILPHIPFEDTDSEVKVRNNLVTLYTDFIKSGNPTPSTASVTSVPWPQVTKHQFPVLKIGVINSIEPDGYRPADIKLLSRLYNYVG